MPIVVRYDPVQPLLQAAQNAGQFATSQALNAQTLRNQQFADEQARGAAGFALQGLGQAFSQRQQVNDNVFRQQQADAQHSYQQQELDAQLERARIAAQGQDEAAQLRSQGNLDVAGVRGDYGLQREGLRQSGYNDRSDAANQLHRDLFGQGEQARLDRMNQDEGFKRDMGDVAYQRQQERDQAVQEFQQTRDSARFQSRLDEINQRAKQSSDLAYQRSQYQSPSDLPWQREQRIGQNQELQQSRFAVADFLRQHPQQYEYDPLDRRNKTPIQRPAAEQAELEQLQQRYHDLASRPPSQRGNAPAQNPTDNFDLSQAIGGKRIIGPDGSTYEMTGDIGPDGTPVVRKVQ